MSPHRLTICGTIATCLAIGVARAQPPDGTGESGPTFGVTVVAPFGFCGRIYEMPEIRREEPDFLRDPDPLGSGSTMSPTVVTREPVAICTAKLPKFERLHPIGNIYTTRLNVPARQFWQGFPGVTGRFEWFAIDYTARFWIETPGRYSFRLLSDDGSALYIDERRIIDNDCIHAPMTVDGSVSLEGGIHEMRVSYFQGPRYHVALVLEVRVPGGQWRIFDTQDFKPPANPADWKFPNSANLDVPMDPCKTERHTPTLIRRR
jgi:hypothetical protein